MGCARAVSQVRRSIAAGIKDGVINYSVYGRIGKTGVISDLQVIPGADQGAPDQPDQVFLMSR